jgi:glycosyltransferase involved in cell wall biosynthesis
VTTEASGNQQLGVVIPAHNEASVIEGCLAALLQSGTSTPSVKVVVAANGCNDHTVTLAQSFEGAFSARGWLLDVLDIPVAGKIGALNVAERSVSGLPRIYLDADVQVEPDLICQTAAVLSSDAPVYVSGKMTVIPPKSLVSRLYLLAWMKTGFMRGVAQGAGVYAVNVAGRRKWRDLPQIISDDTYVRTLFAPSERVEVLAKYHWPLPEGFGNLVKARARQDAGMRELYEKFPAQLANESKPRNEVWSVLVTNPPAFFVYVCVRLAARLKRNTNGWLRGR